jgi:Gram-negative bacterial TonB protein C-terminal
MRVVARSLVGLLAALAAAGVPAAEPRLRPALSGNGPNALVNIINTKKLVERGQGDGLLMFTCHVGPSGKVQIYYIYRETPGSKLLKEEVGNALWGCRFIPAIYNGKPTDVLFIGTVVFIVKGGQPHLRIYANQNRDDIAKGNDFIAPQLIGGTTKWPWDLDNLLAKAKVYRQQGAVQLSISVDANGNQKNLRVVSEDPPGFGFGGAVQQIYSTAKWIPGFRNGRPVDCRFDYGEYFQLVPAGSSLPR